MSSMAAMGMMLGASWTATDTILTFAMWGVMMVGMMAPSATPMLLLFGASGARRANAGTAPPVLLFGIGYIIVWLGFSAFATLAQWALQTSALLSPAMEATNARFGGALLIAAGVYQLTPFKRACLTHCQSPMAFLMSHWREGARGALQMGLSHGIYCLGCCWALMIVLFAVGVMNLAWVAALTVFILLERIAPPGVIIARLGGVLLIVLGVVYLFR
jgi:predicted metal-binding membrane protein